MMNKIDILKSIIQLETVEYFDDFNNFVEEKQIIELEFLNEGIFNLILSEKQLDHLRSLVFNPHKLIYIVFNNTNFIWADKNKLDFLEKSFRVKFLYEQIKELKIIMQKPSPKIDEEFFKYETNLIQNIFLNTKTTPMPYQERASKLAIVNEKYGFFLEPGLGKTKTSLDAASYFLEQKKIEQVFIYAPASLLTNWHMEMKKHFNNEYIQNVKILSHTDLSLISSKQKRRDTLIESLSQTDDPKEIKKLNKKLNLIQDSEFIVNLEKIREGKILLIFDEVHHFKGEESIRTRLLLENLTEKSKIFLLTGTPNPKGVLDLYVYGVLLGLFNISYEHFVNKYLVITKTKYGIKPKYEKREMVNELLEQFKYKSSWIKKEDVLTLPEKNYLTYYYSLNSEQQEIIDKFLHDSDIKLSNTFSYTEKQIQDCLIRVLQVQNGFLLDANKEVIELKNNNKLDLLFEIVHELGDTPIIIFCVFTAEADIINRKLNELGYKSVSRHGKRNKKEADPIDAFMSGEANILVATTSSTGTGFTLVHSNNIIYYSNDFNLINRIQSEDRIHRIGQEKTCNYYDLLAENSLDEIIYNCIQKRSIELNSRFEQARK